MSHPGESSVGAETATDVAKRLRAAFDSGRTRPVEWRKAQLHSLKRMLAEREIELLDALRRDLGKPPVEGFVTGLHRSL